MKFGDLEIFILCDGRFRLDGGAMFGVVPRVLWEKKSVPDSRNRITLGLNSVFIWTGQQSILVETGIGDKMSAKWLDIYGVEHTMTLPESLHARGLAPEELDIIVNTHLHFDHCGWNTRYDKDGRPVPTFPRAQYYLQRGELEHARYPSTRDQASYLPENFEPIAAADQWVLLDADQEIAPGVELIRVPGHTRDMQCVRLCSQGRTAFVFGDLIPTTAHLPYAWVMAYDLYPLETVEQKQRLLPEAVRNEWLCLFVHDPNIPAAYLREENGKIVPEPVSELALVSTS